jgi:formate dehydrogenase iron-sulfur subunit
MPTSALEIRAISGPAGAAPGKGAKRTESGGVCKLIDVTTCIGCKACEVACLEWNGYPFTQTTFDNTYQTMPDLRWNYYNLIRFNEHDFEDGSFGLLMRKDGCMHCVDPGCLRACPAEGAIVQYSNGTSIFSRKTASDANTA